MQYSALRRQGPGSSWQLKIWITQKLGGGPGFRVFFATAMRASQRALASSQELRGLSAFGPSCNIFHVGQRRSDLGGEGQESIVYT